MELLENTTFNESTDSFQPIVPGVYPGHVTSFEARDVNDAIEFNLVVTLHEKVGELEVPIYKSNEDGTFATVKDEDGNELLRKATHLVGKEIRTTGIWLTPSPKDGEGWKNRKYKEFCESLGVAFPSDDKGNVQLGKIEEDDVLGNPCLAKVGEEKFTNKEGQEKTTMRVFNCFPWSSGQQIPRDELGIDVPF